ncbi:MAG TPA: glycosyltransferase family A protein [Flavobacterium sp.]|uniref:glycosyltransferase family A protein n=1 Tax=Flavobacterium sp. TaxID=239 RepID=UPI002C4626C9|nr:glycosyltransferase family A protein [Flavobacterium sp.]HSD13288.1 glycosyltransferase family A protein [Flavobacterium sp.]
MRIGSNPNNHKTIDLNAASHRVIIPIYIPNAEGYFKDSFAVLKVCIHSLLATVNKDTVVSLISNGSSEEVNNYIKELWSQGKIDRAVFNKENVGKMNAIIAETRASFEEFITYSDADVFFDKGWLQQTFDMFRHVPKAGFVSMNPTPRNYSHADSTLFDNLFTVLFKKRKTSDVCAFDDLAHFHKSVGQNNEFTEKMFAGTVFCVGKHLNYIIGAGHFCCTIRKTPTLRFVPKEKSYIGVSGGSESIYLDIPFDKTGLWRLSSPKACVWHMGNTLEKEWTECKLNALKEYNEKEFSFQVLPFQDVSFLAKIIPYFIRSKTSRLLKKIKILS